jgi:hypothetical protein
MSDWRVSPAEQAPAAGRGAKRVASHFLRSACLPAAFAAVLQGCDRAPSAGVVSPFHDPSIPTWHVVLQPELQLGGADEREGYVFDGVRGAALLSDRLAVADGGSLEIRFYTLDGAFVARSGRRGAGPGEYQWITTIAPFGDTAVGVWDGLLSRITIVDRGGNVVRTLEPDLSGTSGVFSVQFVGTLQQGQLVFADRTSIRALQDAEPGPRQDSVAVTILDADGRWNGTVLKQRGPETWLFREGSFWNNDEILFARSAFQAVAGGDLVLATNDSLEFSRVDGDGEVVASAVLPWTHRPVTRAEAEAERAARLREAENLPKLYSSTLINGRPFRELVAPFQRRVIERLPASEAWPAFGEMRGDAAGRVWVAEYLGRASTATERTWIVLDPEFRPVGRVVLPAGFQMLAVGEDRIVGLSKDDWGREAVSIYRIRR